MKNIKKPLASFIALSALFILLASPTIANALMVFPETPVPKLQPNWNINFTLGGVDINEGGEYEFILNQGNILTYYVCPTGNTGQIYGEIYKGELNNSVLASAHSFNLGGSEMSADTLLSAGNYFVVVYNIPTCRFCFLASVSDIRKWFESGLSEQGASAPYNWGIINFTVTEEVQNIPPILSYSEESGYASDTASERSEGIHPNKGTADKTEMIFKIVYADSDNDAPNEMNVFVGDGVSTTTLAMLPDISATATLTDGDYTNGEQFTAISTFPKGKYQYWFESSDGTNIVRQPATSTLTFQTGYSNVAFLPGLKASRLYKDGTLFENQLWEPNVDSDVEKLFLDSSGDSIDSSVYTRDVIDQANIIPTNPLSLLRQNFYLSFKNDMEKLRKDGVINDWKALPYDWRLDYGVLLESGKVIDTNVGEGSEENISYLFATSSPYILQEIERLAKSSANGKVTIVAHSNGGLLAKKLIDKLETKSKADLVENLILVASPQLGTPKAIASLLHGYKEDIPKDFGFFSSRATAREFGKNLIPGYNLLPSAEYMSRVKDVDENNVAQNSTTIIEFGPSLDSLAETINFREFWGSAITTLNSAYNFRNYYGDKITTAQKLNEFLRGAEGRAEPSFGELEYPIKLSASHLESAKDTHGLLDTWQVPENSGIQVIQIAGWGLDTIRGIKYVTKDKQVCLDDLSLCDTLPVLDVQPLWTSDGDKVVVTPSATAMSGSTDSTYYVNLPKYNNGFKKNREHASILEVDQLRDFIENIIVGKQNILPNYITAIKPPQENSKIRLALHSPVSINIYDSFGNHTGIKLDESSGIRHKEEQIPNSYYVEFGEGKYLGLDTSNEYRIELQGEDYGTFTFEIQEVLGDQVLNSIEYLNIPVSPTTKAELVIQTLDTTPEISLDVDGDGTIDIILDNTNNGNGLVSIKVLKEMIKDLDIDRKIKKHILKDLKKVKKELNRDRNEKAIKYLDKIIKKLKKEIKKNLRTEKDDDKHDKKNEKDKYKKHDKKKKDHHDDDDKKKDKKHDNKKDKKDHHKNHNDDKDKRKEKISTKDAWVLISIVEDIKSLLVK